MYISEWDGNAIMHAWTWTHGCFGLVIKWMVSMWSRSESLLLPYLKATNQIFFKKDLGTVWMPDLIEVLSGILPYKINTKPGKVSMALGASRRGPSRLTCHHQYNVIATRMFFKEISNVIHFAMDNQPTRFVGRVLPALLDPDQSITGSSRCHRA